MRAGHNANKAMDYYTARRHFTECYELGGRVEAHISAVNMTLKLEEYQKAADQYAELLKQDLEPPVAISADLPRPRPHPAPAPTSPRTFPSASPDLAQVMKIIQRKHREAVEKLSAQALRAENKARPGPPPLPPTPIHDAPSGLATTPLGGLATSPLSGLCTPAWAGGPNCVLAPGGASLTRMCGAAQELGSMEHMPPVAVQAFPVDDEADEARDKNTGLGRRERARLDLRGPSPGGRSSLPKQATRLPPFAAQPAQRLPKQSAQGQPGRPLLCGQSPWQGQPPGRGRLSSARPQTHPGSNSRPPAPGLGADGRRARVMCSRRSSR